MRRPYNMSSRAIGVARTRSRILDAALEVFAERGFRGGSIQAIGRRAQLSPATVLNHFKDTDALIMAATGRLQGRLEFPSPAQVAEIDDLRQRLMVVVHALVACYETTQQWQQLFRRDGDLPILSRAIAEFEGEVSTMLRAALGPLADTAATLGVIAVLAGPDVARELRLRGLPDDTVVPTMVDIMMAWLHAETEGL